MIIQMRQKQETRCRRVYISLFAWNPLSENVAHPDGSEVFLHLPLTPSRNILLARTFPFFPSINPSRMSSHFGEPLKALRRARMKPAKSTRRVVGALLDGEVRNDDSVEMWDVEARRSSFGPIVLGTGGLTCRRGLTSGFSSSSSSWSTCMTSSSTCPSAHRPHPVPTDPRRTPITFIQSEAPLTPFLANIPPVMPNTVILAMKWDFPSSVSRRPELRRAGLAEAAGRRMENRGKCVDRCVMDGRGSIDGREGMVSRF